MGKYIYHHSSHQNQLGEYHPWKNSFWHADAVPYSGVVYQFFYGPVIINSCCMKQGINLILRDLKQDYTVL